MADGVQIRQLVGSSGVGDGNLRVRGQELDQIVINAGLFTFHIHCVHEEFGTTGGELAQDGFVQGHFGEGLPTIGHHPVPATAQATGKIQHQPLGADGLGQRGEAFLI